MIIGLYGILSLVGAFGLLLSRSLLRCVLYAQLCLISEIGLMQELKATTLASSVGMITLVVCSMLLLSAVLLINIRKADIAPRRLLLSKGFFFVLILFLTEHLWELLPESVYVRANSHAAFFEQYMFILPTLGVFIVVVLLGSLAFLRDNQ